MFAQMLLSLSLSNLDSKHSSYSDPTTDSEPRLTLGSFVRHHGDGVGGRIQCELCPWPAFRTFIPGSRCSQPNKEQRGFVPICCLIIHMDFPSSSYVLQQLSLKVNLELLKTRHGPPDRDPVVPAAGACFCRQSQETHACIGTRVYTDVKVCTLPHAHLNARINMHIHVHNFIW